MKDSQKVAIQISRKNLTNWATQEAHKLSRILGFGFEDAPLAPETIESIKAGFNDCLAGKALTYKVWSGCSQKTIFLNPHANYAFRFVHDWLHYSKGLDLSPVSEYQLAGMHLESFQKMHPNDKLGFHLLLADTAGQTQLIEKGAEFPSNQLAFALRFARRTIKKIY